MKDDGGAAFPSGLGVGPEGDIYSSDQWNNTSGMSLRQWYAGLAMQGMLAACNENIRDYQAGLSFINSMPAESFKMADAMIAESEKTDV